MELLNFTQQVVESTKGTHSLSLSHVISTERRPSVAYPGTDFMNFCPPILVNLRVREWTDRELPRNHLDSRPCGCKPMRHTGHKGILYHRPGVPFRS